MKKYIEFIGSLHKTPGFKEILPILLTLQIATGISNAVPLLIILTIILSLSLGGFWVEYLSNAINCEVFAFPHFKNNIKRFISMGFRFGFVNILYVMPFVILTIITAVVGLGSCRDSFGSGDITILLPKFMFFTAIALLWLCVAFYIFPLVAMRFAVTKSVKKTLNIRRMYVLWHRSKNIYRKMFNDIVIVSTMFFIIGIVAILLPCILMSGSIATMAMNKMNPMELTSTMGSSFAMGIVLGLAIYFVISLLSIMSTFAIYKIIATYYRIPPKSAVKEAAEVY